MSTVYLLKMEGEDDSNSLDGGKIIGIYTDFDQAISESKKLESFFKDMDDTIGLMIDSNSTTEVDKFIQNTNLDLWLDTPVIVIKSVEVNMNLYESYFDGFYEDEEE
jgi:hypothetical protein